MRWLGVAARLVVGGVWIAAAVLKLPDPAANVRAVRAYQLLPESVVPTVGHAIPIAELLIGACLILGLLLRPMAVLSSILLLGFVVGISSAWVRGLQIECGCFGGGGGPSAGASDKYPWELARDGGLMLASLLLVWRPQTPLSLDNLINRITQRSLDGAEQVNG